MIIVILSLIVQSTAQFGASQDEMDLFDLVEEVGVENNFYEFIGLTATSFKKYLHKKIPNKKMVLYTKFSKFSDFHEILGFSRIFIFPR